MLVGSSLFSFLTMNWKTIKFKVNPNSFLFIFIYYVHMCSFKLLLFSLLAANGQVHYCCFTCDCHQFSRAMCLLTTAETIYQLMTCSCPCHFLIVLPFSTEAIVFSQHTCQRLVKLQLCCLPLSSIVIVNVCRWCS